MRRKEAMSSNIIRRNKAMSSDIMRRNVVMSYNRIRRNKAMSSAGQLNDCGVTGCWRDTRNHLEAQSMSRNSQRKDDGCQKQEGSGRGRVRRKRSCRRMRRVGGDDWLWALIHGCIEAAGRNERDNNTRSQTQWKNGRMNDRTIDRE